MRTPLADPTHPPVRSSSAGVRHHALLSLAATTFFCLPGCGGPDYYYEAEDCGDTAQHAGDASGGDGDGDGDALANPSPDAIDYRALESHPGCSTADLGYAPAQIPGYTCAAKEFTQVEDTSLPIVLLIHGNSDGPEGWESHTDTSCDPVGATQGAPMLAERLAAAGFKTLAIDMRPQLGDDPAGNNDTENAAKNMSHGWGTPLAQHFIRSVAEAYPGRQLSLIGFSFGVTVIRDALRRLDVNEDLPLWSRIDDVILLAGGNHGVSTFHLCGTNQTMRGAVTCEMGDRAAFSPTPFLRALNGAAGEWESPCAVETDAFGRDRCGGRAVDYTTIVMQDIPGGTQQDLFVSESSAYLAGADNVSLGLNEFDQSDYFFCGLFKNHYGAARSEAAMEVVLARLQD